MKKDGRYTCKPFEFAIAFLDEVFVFHLGIVNLQDTFARGLMKSLCYGSVCSDIESATLVWEALGWRPWHGSPNTSPCKRSLLPVAMPRKRPSLSMEVQRFERVQALGRLGLFSLTMLDAEFVGRTSAGWPTITCRLASDQYITPEAADAAARLWAFGELNRQQRHATSQTALQASLITLANSQGKAFPIILHT